MTMAEALAASPTGLAVRAHNATFMMVVTKSRQAYYYSPTAVAPASWPKETDDWMILKSGPTADRLNKENVR